MNEIDKIMSKFEVENQCTRSYRVPCLDNIMGITRHKKMFLTALFCVQASGLGVRMDRRRDGRTMANSIVPLRHGVRGGDNQR